MLRRVILQGFFVVFSVLIVFFWRFRSVSLKYQLFFLTNYIAVVLVLFGLASPVEVVAEFQIFSDKSTGISFYYPSELNSNPQLDYSEVIVALSSGFKKSRFNGRDSGKKFRYPSFNVTRQAGSFNSQSLSQVAERVLGEYRSLGLDQVGLVRSFWRNFPGAVGKSPVIHLKFLAKAELFTALVALVPSDDEYYILTYIDQTRQYEHHDVWRKAIFESFSLTGAPLVPEIVTNTEKSSVGLDSLLSWDYPANEQKEEVKITDPLVSNGGWGLENSKFTLNGVEGGYGIIGAIIALAGFFGLRRPRS
jgi:hypothetical protein